jgi:hypothetical protein
MQKYFNYPYAEVICYSLLVIRLGSHGDPAMAGANYRLRIIANP